MLPLLVFWIAVTPPDQMFVVGGEFVHIVQSGDSLTSIGARYGVPVEYLAELNGWRAEAPLNIGQELRVDNLHIVPAGFSDGIVVNIPQKMLFVFEAGDLVAHYPVAVGGADWKTVTGNFEVVRKEENPVWNVPPSIQEEMRRKGQPVLTRVPASPENPLGTHYLALSVPGFGIHGTNKPASIYSFQTHGCIRLHPDDIADLFSRVSVGTAVHIIYEPALFAESAGQLLLEVHFDVYGKKPNLVREVTARLARFRPFLEWNSVLKLIRDCKGIAIVLPTRYSATRAN